MKIEEIHQCEESEGKIVCITINNLGITRCAYCNQVVDYTNYFKYKEAERQLEALEEK